MKDEDKRPEPGKTVGATFRETLWRDRFWFGGLLVAIVLGGVYCGLIYPMFTRNKIDPRSKVAVLISDLKLACENFRLEIGQYPWPKPKEVTATTLISGRGVYIELRGLAGAMLNGNQDYLGEVNKGLLKNGVLVDRWGHEILFRVDPTTGNAVIWSCGPNGIDETNDGDSPDPAKYPKGYYWFGKGDTGDDITSR